MRNVGSRMRQKNGVCRYATGKLRSIDLRLNLMNAYRITCRHKMQGRASLQLKADFVTLSLFCMSEEQWPQSKLNAGLVKVEKFTATVKPAAVSSVTGVKIVDTVFS